MAVVAALTAVLFVAVLRWVFGFANATASSSEANNVGANASFVTQALTADLTRATVCSPSTAPFVTVNSTQIAFYADVEASNGTGGPDGIVDLVEWRFQGGVVQRAVVAGTGSCPALLAGQANAQWETVADGLSATSTNVFTVFRNGSTSPAPSPGDCTGSAVSSCLFDRVSASAELVAPNGAPAPINVTVPISYAGSLLAPAG